MQQQKFSFLIRSAGFVSILVGFVVLAGWFLNIQILRTVIHGYPSMKFNTALCFVLAGLGFIMLAEQNRVAGVLSKLCLSLVIILCSLSASESLFHFHSAVGSLLFDHPASAGPDGGRMSLATAFSFLLLSISVMLAALRTDTVREVVQYVLHFVSAVATIVIVGYLYAVPSFYKMFFLSSVALHTGITLFLLSASASFINSDKGITGLFLGREIGNKMARDIFPYLLILILVSGFLRLQFFRSHEGAIEFGIAFVTTSFILLSLLIIGLTAKQLNRINRQRLDAEESLRSITEQRRFEEQMAKEEERKKKEIMDAIIKAQEKERYEISHELHDNVSQVLTTCKLLMETAAHENDNKFIRLSCEHLQLAIDEIRNLSHQLDPATLKHIGLHGSINDLIGAVNKTKKIQIQFKFGVTNMEKVKSDIQLALFRIVQEQVNNILKHSDARKASIELIDKGENIKLSIRDDGKGHDLAMQKHGLGLRNIFNRVEFHKGEAKINSEPEQGFELEVVIPRSS